MHARNIVVVVATLGTLCACRGETPFEWESSSDTPQETVPTGPPKRIYTDRFISHVRAEPDAEARKIGHLRVGSVLQATTHAPVGHRGCEGGWYPLSSRGYVCDGGGVKAFLGEELPDRPYRQPDLQARLPYPYASVREPTPLYRRLPSDADAAVHEGYVPPGGEKVSANTLAPANNVDRAAVRVPPPSSVATEVGDKSPGRPVTLAELNQPRSSPVQRILLPGFYVSLDREFTRGEREYWRTLAHGFVPKTRLRMREGSAFSGVELGENRTLPIEIERPQFSRQVALQSRPDGVAADEKWIDIDLSNQALVAYEGDRPVYATLISSGKTTVRAGSVISHATPTGLYRIYAKHLTSTMDSDSEYERPYSIEDVPYVMFFERGYALHAAFWHDRFGRPTSHGCINLAPKDAGWLFAWAGPTRPEGWHSVYPTDDNSGTWVHVHGAAP